MVNFGKEKKKTCDGSRQMNTLPKACETKLFGDSVALPHLKQIFWVVMKRTDCRKTSSNNN